MPILKSRSCLQLIDEDETKEGSGQKNHDKRWNDDERIIKVARRLARTTQRLMKGTGNAGSQRRQERTLVQS
jgi:hypothetical protein